jgi:hypothetical protein
MRRFLVVFGLSMAIVGWAFPTGAAGKSFGGVRLKAIGSW